MKQAVTACGPHCETRKGQKNTRWILHANVQA